VIGNVKLTRTFFVEMGNVVACLDGRSEITATDRAVLDLKILKRNLQKRAQSLEETANAYKARYRELGATRNPSSYQKRLLLRHVGALDKALDQCHSYIYRVDEMLLDIGHQETLVQVTQTLRDGTRAMERMNRLLMSAGDLESTMQDAAESRERHRELAAVLRGDAGTSAGETGAGLDMHDDFHVSDAELEALRERIAREGPTTGHMSLTSGTKTTAVTTMVPVVTRDKGREEPVPVLTA